jgi:soluble lytic murein transglycosylase-like protein
MSIEAAMSRINQIQSMLATGINPAPAQPQTGASFSAALATAQGPAGAGTNFAAMAAGTPAAAATKATASAGASELPAGTPYAAEITAAAKANGVDPALLAGLVKQESGFKPDAGSHAGARGLTQLMPATAAGLGVTNVLDPVQNLNGGAKYLKQQLDAFNGDTALALAAYNAGPGAVKRFGGIPPYAETQNYVRIVQQNAASFATPASASPSPTSYSSSNAPSEI